MTREEIREGMAKRYCEGCYEDISDRCEILGGHRPCEHAYKQVDILQRFEHSQGVVIKAPDITDFSKLPDGVEVWTVKSLIE